MQVHVNGLLRILRNYPCHSDFPADARTLLRTPRKFFLAKMHPGEYFHFGVLAAIQQEFSLIDSLPQTDSIEIAVNADGLPIWQ